MFFILNYLLRSNFKAEDFTGYDSLILRFGFILYTLDWEEGLVLLIYLYSWEWEEWV
jgi:hypothetical protein